MAWEGEQQTDYTPLAPVLQETDVNNSPRPPAFFAKTAFPAGKAGPGRRLPVREQYRRFRNGAAAPSMRRMRRRRILCGRALSYRKAPCAGIPSLFLSRQLRRRSATPQGTSAGHFATAEAAEASGRGRLRAGTRCWCRKRRRRGRRQGQETPPSCPSRRRYRTRRRVPRHRRARR